MKREIIRFENVHCMDNLKKCINGLYVTAFEGEICGIMLNNLREKDYLIELFAGRLPVMSGWVYFEGRKMVSGTLEKLFGSAISFIGPERCVFDALTIRENIFVPRKDVRWFDSVRELCREAEQILEELDISLPLGEAGHYADEGQVKLVELLRAYVSGSRLVVMHDLGSIMTERQEETFFSLVDVLKERGLAFVYVEKGSTRLMKYMDRVLVVKKGRTVGIWDDSSYTRQSVYTRLLGKNMEEGPVETSHTEDKGRRKVLQLSEVKLEGLTPFEVSLFDGEVLNIFDRDYDNFRNLLQILQGEDLLISGRVLLNGVRVTGQNISGIIKRGMGFIEAGDTDTMLYMDLTVMDNLLMMLVCSQNRHIIKRNYMRLVKSMLAGAFTDEELDSRVYETSEACRLKLVYYRWILVRPSVLVCVRPFASNDFELRQLTIELLQKARSEGIAIVIMTTQEGEAYTLPGKNLTFAEGHSIVK